MSCIHYKFKSSLDYNSVTFDGLHLSLADLKKAIIQQKRLKPGEFDLEITNAQTNDVYKKNDELIAKNTSVIVSRVPMNKTTASSTQKSWEAFKQECAKVKEKERLMTLEKLKQTPDLVIAPASEIDKIKAVIDQSTKGFESSSLLGKNQSTIPHEHYICKRCGQKGHYISTCPNSNAEDRIVEPRYKRTTGIPSTMLTIVDDPMHPGALLTHHGQFAVPTVDVLGYRETKKERPPFLPGESQPEPEKKKIPQELLCHICEDLCVDAAIAPCCGTSFCDECLREVLLESDDHQCPSCKETNVSPDRIVANRSMRLAVTNFLNDTGYTKARRRRTLSSGPEASQTKAPSPRKPSPSRSPLTSALPAIKPETSPSYTDSSQESGNNIPHQVQPNNNTTSFMHGHSESRYHNPSYRSYGRPPRFSYNHQQYHKPWRYSNDRRTDHNSAPAWRKDNNYNSVSSHSLSDGTSASPAAEKTMQDNSKIAERSSSAENTVTSNISTVTTNTNQNSAVTQSSAQSRGQHHWPRLTGSATENQANVLVTPAHLLNAASFLLANSIPLLSAPPPTHRPYQAMQGYHQQIGYQATRPAAPVPVSGGLLATPMSKEEFYQTKKMIQQADIPKKKPIDVFDSFADLTKRRSRTPERRRSYSRSRSGSWKKHSRSRSLSVGKKRSLSPRRRSSRSHSRSRSRSRQRSQHRSHSRSLGPSRISRQHSRSLTPLARKSKSRSRSGPRSPKALSPRTGSPLPPLRRSSKSPLLLRSRSRSRSYKRFTRSRSKSWSKRTRSRSFSRPRSPRQYSRSPRRSPRRSPPRSPLHKALYSPRRKSRSYSPRRRSPFRSRSRTPLKRISSRSRTRSPYLKKSFSPARSPHRAKSPYKKPMSPVQLRRLSPQPYRGGQFRPRGRGRFGYRDNDKFRSYHSPPRLQPPLPAPVLPTNLPPVPYNPQMGLPPPEEYFKYNPAGYQEFVRNFYAQFGPQAQAWAQNQTFQLPNSDGISSNLPHNNPYMPNQRMMPWDSVPMSPSQRPRSITPPRNRKDQNNRENSRNWEKDNRDRRGDRGRDSDRNRESDQHRKEMGERKFIAKEEDRYKFRESRDSGKPRDKSTSDRKSSPIPKARDENKTKEKRRHDKKREEKEKKTKKRWDGDSKKEKNELKESTLKTSPVSEQEMSYPQLAEKADSREIVKAKSYSVVSVVDTVSKSVLTDSAEQPVSEIKTEKPLLKERKPVGKKKGDGLGGKKKSREGLADDGEKKVKKTKKKKLTFGSSDADSKQGLKKKKVKRLVDYKSENCASEDGEDRGSPLKKAKLSEGEEKKDEVTESNPSETAHVNTSEPTFEVSTEGAKNPAGENIFEEISSIDLKLEGEKDEKELGPISKSELVPELPQLSKWERDDFDLFEAIEQPKEKTQEKMMLPRSVVDKAEKFLSHKPMKNAVIAAHTTASSKSPESPQDSDKRGADTVPSRRVFIERKDSRDKKTSDLQITVKTDKNKNESSKRVLSTKTEESRHRYHHNDSDYEEDQRSVVKSHSLERELQEKSKSRRSREREKKREDRDTKRDEKEASKRDEKEASRRDERKDSRSHKDSSIEKNDKKDKTDSVKEKQRDSRDSESKEKRQSKDAASTSSIDTHKSSKDLRHKLEEKAKAKSTIDPRKLSVLDESEFVPDYEDLGVDMSSDKEINDAVVTKLSTSPETPTNESKRRKKDEESETKTEETDTEDGSKHKKSKKKHKHKEKKEKKEKHKHKKKKHKHKKSKEEKESSIQSP